MKCICFFFATIFYIGSFAQKAEISNKFIVSGKVHGQDTGIVVLGYLNGSSQVINDTVVLKNGVFMFEGLVSEPTLGFLSGRVRSQTMDDPNRTEFFIEPGNMSINLTVNDFKHATVIGSHTQAELDSVKRERDAVFDALGVKALQSVYQDLVYKLAKDKENTELQNQTKLAYGKLAPYREALTKIDFKFVAGHPRSYLSPYLLRFHFPRTSPDSLKMFYESFNYNIQNSFSGKMVKEQIMRKYGVGIGNPAVNFQTKDIAGEFVDLSVFKSQKFVLLDFWASWCIPCRQGNPYLIELYKKYHDKGLEIISISTDMNQEDWKKAITKDQVGIWHHVLADVRERKEGEMLEHNKEFDIASKYLVGVLPTKILVNKNGTIILRNESDNNKPLTTKLKEIFGF